MPRLPVSLSFFGSQLPRLPITKASMMILCVLSPSKGTFTSITQASFVVSFRTTTLHLVGHPVSSVPDIVFLGREEWPWLADARWRYVCDG
ncbi:hypothetical protein EMCRGX_G005427 [Ephydatia muelleri]